MPASRGSKRPLIFLLACALPIGTAHGEPAQPIITFEEAIPQPDTVRTQYCNNPATNKGVEFVDTVRIVQPTSGTASPTHAATNYVPGDEFGENRKLFIRFTKDQSMVGLKIGLTRARPYPVTARLTAYSGTTPGAGQLSESTVSLGLGPTPITQSILVTAQSGNIRTVVLAFEGPSAGNADFETIDDLTFSVIGPPCVSDTAPPSVQITTPATDGATVYTSQLELAFAATDNETGIAKVKVTLLDATGSELESFFVCGADTGPVCLYDTVPYKLSYDFYTWLAPGTSAIRVTAWDFADHSAQTQRTVDHVTLQSLNLWAMGMEITQATQPWVAVSTQARSATTPEIPVSATSSPFVAGKRTVVRIYPGIEVTGQVTLPGALATLSCKDLSGSPCPDSPLPPLSIPVSTASNNDLDTLRSDPDKTWNFTLPEAWTKMTGAITLTAKVAPPLGVGECSGCDDGANSLTVSGAQFQETNPLKLTLLWACVRRKETDPITTCETSPLNAYKDIFQTAGSLFVETYPVASKDIQVSIHNPQTTAFDGNFLLPGGDMTSDRMFAFHKYVCNLIEQETGKKHADIPINRIYFGFVPAPVTLVVGVGNRNCAIAKLAQGSLLGDIETSAEEVGHALGRQHASCDHGEGGCEAAPGVFPCAHGGICTHGFNTGASQVIAPGSPTGVHAHDFMSYGGGEQWISPYTYRHLFDTLRSGGSAGAGPPQTRSAPQEETLWVSGSVTAGTAPSGQLDSAYRFQRPNAPHNPGKGEFSLELQDRAGQVLFAHGFDPEFLRGDPPDPQYQPPGTFSAILPFPPSAARLVLKRGSTALAERVRTPNQPDVIVTAPAAGAAWDSIGVYHISWRASDADGDSLVYLVQYSIDGGVTWSTLASDRSATSLDVDSARLAGSDSGLVRVLATDGFNTGIGQAGPFRVGRKAPVAWISNPRISERGIHRFPQGALVVLEGNGADLEDGPLADGSLTWFSDRDGRLGSGHRLDTTRLAPGMHRITLRAVDATGMSGTAGVSIEIVPQRNTQPRAEAGPDRRAIRVGKAVPLDGSGSKDPDGSPLAYHWSVVSKPPRSMPGLSDASAPRPDFVADRPGNYRLQLIVDDGLVSSLPDRVTVEANRRCWLRALFAAIFRRTR